MFEPSNRRGSTHRIVWWLVLAPLTLLLFSPVSPTAAAEPPGPDAAIPDFNTQIRPLLSDRCFVCHGPDGDRREADLRLDLESEAKASVITPGAAEDSELVRRIESTDADERMPPPDSNLSLSADEKALLRRWIDSGAEWNEHWAFKSPKRGKPPEVKRKDWARDELDLYILSRLEAAGFEPTSAATPRQLIRRLSFDLTGLPPKPDEVERFAAEMSAAPDRAARDKIYAALVDRLLQSPAYGERMAAVWLDAARYSDTYGYQVDRDRFVWPYRDWVIQAFNRNLPFDQFATEQLAGDLLPDADEQQVLATAFNRLHPQKVEGGSVPEEFRVEYVADRTQTFATAFLGLTFECARCHDHKYDPLTQAEYYQLFAFFNNIDEAGLYSYFTPSVPTPTLTMLDDGKRKTMEQRQQAAAAAEAKLDDIETSRDQAFATWLEQPPNEFDGEAWKNLTKQIAHLDFEGKPGGGNRQVEGVRGSAVRLSGDDGVDTKVGNFRRSQPFSVAFWMQTPDVKERAVVFHRSRAWTDAGSRGYQLLIEDGRLSASLIHFWPGNAIRVRTIEPIPTKQWLHVAVTYDGSSRAAGLKIFVDGREAPLEIVRDKLTKNITGGGGDTIRIGERFRDRGFTGGDVDEFRVFQRELTPLEVSHLHHPEVLPQAIADAQTDPRSEVAETVRQFYTRAIDADRQAAAETLRKAREEHNKLLDGLREIMVMRELSQRRPTYRLHRGAYDSPRDEVSPGVPAVLPPLIPQQTDEPTSANDSRSADRLALARWLTDPDHPLTGRVAVNRLWQICFGEGLVRTPEDFGSQGRPPTHPALLDRLAYDFAHEGWDTKAMLKRIVTSSTYRQSTRPTDPKLVERDPQNELLGRMSSYRWPAEMIRDQVLAASGLLDAKAGGPPAKPYELQHSFKPITPDKGSGLYRRSVYTFWKRTAPAPLMMTLDASKREVCRVKRERTLSPLQALVMLNGPQFVEASRVLGEQLTADYEQVDERLTRAFTRLTCRPPSDEQLSILKSLYEDQQQRFQADTKAAEQLLSVGAKPRNKSLDAAEAAALTIVVNVLMNYDECVMKR